MQSHQHPERTVLRGTWHCKTPRHYRGEGEHALQASQQADHQRRGEHAAALHPRRMPCTRPSGKALQAGTTHTGGSVHEAARAHWGSPARISSAQGDPLAWGRLKVLRLGPRSRLFLGFRPAPSRASPPSRSPARINKGDSRRAGEGEEEAGDGDVRSFPGQKVPSPDEPASTRGTRPIGYSYRAP